MSAEHADFATLLAYWLGELDEAEESRVEEHYLGCAECSAQLAVVEGLASGVRRAFSAGRVGAVITPAFAERMRSRGLRIREYVVPRNGSVNCTVLPIDQVLLSRLQVPLEGVDRLDVVVAIGGNEVRLEDVPFDAATGEVMLAPSIELIRGLPSHRRVMRLVAVGPGEERVLGEYTFNHTAGHDT
jgi:hypothetical protein